MKQVGNRVKLVESGRNRVNRMKSGSNGVKQCAER